MKNNVVAINERRQKIWTLLTRGMKAYDIAKELGADHSTISRDIKGTCKVAFINDNGAISNKVYKLHATNLVNEMDDEI